MLPNGSQRLNWTAPNTLFACVSSPASAPIQIADSNMYVPILRAMDRLVEATTPPKITIRLRIDLQLDNWMRYPIGRTPIMQLGTKFHKLAFCHQYWRLYLLRMIL